MIPALGPMMLLVPTKYNRIWGDLRTGGFRVHVRDDDEMAMFSSRFTIDDDVGDLFVDSLSDLTDYVESLPVTTEYEYVLGVYVLDKVEYS